jgi:hypothetical protein
MLAAARFGWIMAPLLALGAAHATAADLKVVSGPVMARVLTDLKPRIEHLTKRTLVVDMVPAEAMTQRLRGDDPFDAVVAYEPDAVAFLESNGTVVERLHCVGWERQGQERAPIYAAVSREAKERDAARRLVAFLSSFQGLMALSAQGLEGTPNE